MTERLGMRGLSTRAAVVGSARGVVFAGAAFALAVLVSGPFDLLARLDLKPGCLRDFHLYIAQSRAYLAGSGVTDNFVYPPLLALLLLPLAVLPPALADAAWWVVQFVVLACYARLLARILVAHGRWRWPLAIALLVTSMPVLHNLKWGQVSSAIALLSASWLIAPSRSGAIGVGLAAACKVFPIAYALPPLAWRRSRLVLLAVGCTLAFGVLIPIAALGVTPTRATLQHVGESARLPLTTPIAASQDLGNALRQWFGYADHVGPYAHKTAWLFALPASVQPALFWAPAIALAFAVWRATRGASTGSASVAAIILLVVPLLLPLAWEHYFCALPLAIAAVLAELECDRRALGFALLAWAIPALGLWAQLFDDWNFFVYESAHATTLAAMFGILAAGFMRSDRVVPAAQHDGA